MIFDRIQSSKPAQRHRCWYWQCAISFITIVITFAPGCVITTLDEVATHPEFESYLTRPDSPDPSRPTHPESDKHQETEHVALEDRGAIQHATVQEASVEGSSVASASLQAMEHQAVEQHPGLQKIQLEIDALRGKLIQAGLFPNPNGGIFAEDINENGGAGRYGFFYSRELVRGGKLSAAQRVVCSEIDAAIEQYAILENRVLTDVRLGYYEFVIAHQKVKIAQELFQLADSAVNVSNTLFAAKEVAKTAVLQAELEEQNTQLALAQANNELEASKRKLEALVGELPELNPGDNDIDQLEALESFDDSFEEIIQNSPELDQKLAAIEVARRRLHRESVEPIPNLTWQAGLAFDMASDDWISNFQISMPLMVLNRNQGAIKQAHRELIAAERDVAKTEQQLRQRLAAAYQDYVDARLRIEAYRGQILPKSKESLELIAEGYRLGEVEFLQWLNAQRTYSQIQNSYLEALEQAWQQSTFIRGLLLANSQNN